MVSPMPIFPLLRTVRRSERPVSPPELVRIPRFSPLRMSILGSVVPRKARVPEREAVPATSSLAVGEVVLIPILPEVSKVMRVVLLVSNWRL